MSFSSHANAKFPKRVYRIDITARAAVRLPRRAGRNTASVYAISRCGQPLTAIARCVRTSFDLQKSTSLANKSPNTQQIAHDRADS